MASSRVLGIDCSTKKMSWVIVHDDGIEKYDEIYFEGTNFIDRYKDVRLKVLAEIEKGTFDQVDYICFEKAVMVRSADVALKLAGVFAVALSCLGDLDAKMVEVQPTVWQSAIGNPIIRGEAKKQLLRSHSELKTKSAQQTFVRNYRKGVTRSYVKNRSGVDFDIDDLSDAAGLAYFWADKVKELYEE